jgi:hypothetical protein
MRKPAIVVAMAFALLAPPLAQAKDWSKVNTYGPGGYSCGRWLEERKATPETLQMAAMTSWMLGFITATEIYSPDDLKTGDVYAFQAEMDNICRALPLEPFATGVTRLVQELGAKPRSAQ